MAAVNSGSAASTKRPHFPSWSLRERKADHLDREDADVTGLAELQELAPKVAVGETAGGSRAAAANPALRAAPATLHRRVHPAPPLSRPL
eukprot:15469869-Alexandrium_andersonii.AAC.1